MILYRSEAELAAVIEENTLRVDHADGSRSYGASRGVVPQPAKQAVAAGEQGGSIADVQAGIAAYLAQQPPRYETVPRVDDPAPELSPAQLSKATSDIAEFFRGDTEPTTATATPEECSACGQDPAEDIAEFFARPRGER
jgi:hypothetical protein